MFEQIKSVLSIGRKDQPSDPTIWFVKLSVIILTAGTIISTYGTFKESHLICEFPDKFDSNVAHSVCSMKGTRSTEEFNQNENIVPIEITSEKQGGKESKSGQKDPNTKNLLGNSNLVLINKGPFWQDRVSQLHEF